MGKNTVKRKIDIEGNKFDLEIYLRIEVPGLYDSKEIVWEIFPYDYQASLYALENKQEINNIIWNKHISEPRTK